MKPKHLLIGILTIVIMVFISGCIQEEKTVSDKDVPVSTDDKEVPKWKISDSLEFCLRDNVYGKEGNWVNLAEERCEPLLPANCLFGYGKAGYRETGIPFDYTGRSTDGLSSPGEGKFGVYCPAEFSKDLKDCQVKLDYQQSTDSEIIRTIYENCWDFVDDTCMFVSIVREPYYNMFYCLVS